MFKSMKTKLALLAVPLTTLAVNVYAGIGEDAATEITAAKAELNPIGIAIIGIAVISLVVFAIVKWIRRGS